MRVFLLKTDKIGSGPYELSKKEMKYLSEVLRLEDGTVFKAKDGKEDLYDAKLMGDILELTPASDTDNFLDAMPGWKGPRADITVYACMLKGKKNEKIARELQEAGVKRLTFVRSAFTQTKELGEHDRERILTIRNEAVQQSGGRVMEITGPVSFEDAVKECEGKAFILHQGVRKKSSNLLKELYGSGCMDISLFIGSEGGFSDEECGLAELSGITPVLLNTNILRAETAAIYTVAGVQTILNIESANTNS